MVSCSLTHLYFHTRIWRGHNLSGSSRWDGLGEMNIYIIRVCFPLLSSDLSRTRRRCSRVRWGGGSLEPTHSPAPAMVCVCDQRGPAPQRWAGQHRRRACVFARMRQREYLCGIGRRLGLLRERDRGACVWAYARRQTGREGCCAGRAVGHGRAQFAQGICGAS